MAHPIVSFLEIFFAFYGKKSNHKHQISNKFKISMTETNCSVSRLKLEAISTSGINSVRARDLDFRSLDIICNL